MKIVIGSDHAGFKKKQKLIPYLTKKQYEVEDLGTDSLESTDYPTYAFLVGEKVAQKEADLGILICKTGIGMSIAANKVKGVRAAKIDDIKEAILAKEHNHANVLCFSSDAHSLMQIKDMIKVFLKAENLGDRHKKRVELIDKYKGKEEPKKKAKEKHAD